MLPYRKELLRSFFSENAVGGFAAPCRDAQKAAAKRREDEAAYRELLNPKGMPGSNAVSAAGRRN